MILSQEFLNCMKDMNEMQIWKFMKTLIALHEWKEIEINSEFTFIVGQVKRYRNWLKEKEEERSQIYRENAFARRNKTKSEQPKKKWWRKKTSEEKKAIHDWNTEIIEKVKEKVESYWLIYKAWKDEWIAASNIRIAKAFKKDSEKFWMTTTQFALAIIDVSMSDKFRRWKIFNCETLYYQYPKVMNQANMNYQTKKSSIGYLPWVSETWIN